MLKNVWTVLKEAGKNWVDDSSPRLGAALSYYTLFAISPLLIIIIFIGSIWLNQDFVRSYLIDEFAGLVGKRGAEALQAALTAAAPQSQGFFASIVAIVTLILTATGLFIELQAALNRIWGVEACRNLGVWGFIKNRLLSFAMVIGIGFLLLVSLVISAALSAAVSYVSTMIPSLGVLWLIVNTAVSFAVITVLFAMIFKVLPDVRIAWRDVWVGSCVTALLFTIGKFLLGMYLGKNTTVSAYGAAGSVVLILLWVYYSAQILFFGAEITQAYANRFGAKLEPKANARWIVPPAASPADQPSSETDPIGEPTLAQVRTEKSKLVQDLRQEVESLRSLVRQHSSAT